MSNPTLLVTGASGQLGRRVLEHLLTAQGARTIIATTRKPETLADFARRGVDVRSADFAVPASLPAAFAGADRALLISSDAIGQRLSQHRTAIAALERAGVRHVVYTSSPPAPSLGIVVEEHQGTEVALANSALEFTLLRNNIYADMLFHSLPAAIASGKLVDARGTGAVSYISRDDCARAAATAMLDGFTGGRTLEIAGAEAITSADLARLASTISGRPVAHVAVSEQQVIEGMVAHGLPEPMAKVYARFDVAAARGELVGSARGFLQLTGAQPQPLSAFLAAHGTLGPS